VGYILGYILLSWDTSCVVGYILLFMGYILGYILLSWDTSCCRGIHPAVVGYILLSWDTSCVVGYPCGIHPVICIAVSIDIVLLNNASSSQEIIMKTFQEWWSQDQCNEYDDMDDKTWGRSKSWKAAKTMAFYADMAAREANLEYAHRIGLGELGQSQLRRVLDGLKKGFGTDNIKDLEGVSFTGENLRTRANLDDQTIKDARKLGILVPGEHGHWKLGGHEDVARARSAGDLTGWRSGESQADLIKIARGERKPGWGLE
jgi:hypothetical protein